MKTRRITLQQARRLALDGQGLDRPWRLPKGKEGAARLVERLGYVQIDTLAVVERAHHHVLWTRQPTYAPVLLEELLATDRRVFEYWTHAASYVPMADYRFYLRTMQQARDWPRGATWRRDNPRIVDQVLERIRREGGLRAADFADPRAQRGTWWDWKPAKRALEVLFNCGELMVSARPNFQRVYDLPERVLPDGLDTSLPDEEEQGRFVVRRALDKYGVATAEQIRSRQPCANLVPAALEQMADAGRITAVQIEDLKGPHYVLTEHLNKRRHKAPPSLHLLSPFDNLIIDRQHTEALFDFHYRIECYTPAAKRRYGYFTLPMLWGDRLIGRLDPKADRKSSVFHVRALHFEEDFADFDAVLPLLADKLRAFATFCGCDRVEVEKSQPAKAKAPLNRLLKP